MAQDRTQPWTASTNNSFIRKITSSWETMYLLLKGVRHAERNADYAGADFGWIHK
jgi:hypothetical protein